MGVKSPLREVEISDKPDHLPEDIEEKRWQVILFNDEVNLYNMVIIAVMKATKCSRDVAEAITLEAHTKGRAVCYIGLYKECEVVYSVLISYKLTAEIQKI